MSKKTRKEKILADFRRQKNQPKVKVFPAENISIPPENHSQQINQNQSIYNYPIHLIKKDLTKTLILCILAISFELALYFILK